VLVEVGKTDVVWTVDEVVGKIVVLSSVVVTDISDVVTVSWLVLVEVGKTDVVWTIDEVVGKSVVLCSVVVIDISDVASWGGVVGCSVVVYPSTISIIWTCQEIDYI